MIRGVFWQGTAKSDEMWGESNRYLWPQNGLDGRGGNDTLHGGEYAHDGLYGGAGNDKLYGGGGGLDFLHGGTGDDLLDDGSYLYGESGNDTLYGRSWYKTTLDGGTGDDVLRGGDHNDTLIGGVGADTLIGGRGKDRFVFDDGDSGKRSGSADHVTDFSHKQRDKLDLSAIDASSKSKGDQAFTFIGAEAFSHHAGELRVVTDDSHTYIRADINGNGTTDILIILDGVVDLGASDFIL